MTDRYWYVVVDDTPIAPERPLTARQAAWDFIRFIEDDDPDQVVEIRQCDEEDLDWAFGDGVRRAFVSSQAVAPQTG